MSNSGTEARDDKEGDNLDEKTSMKIKKDWAQVDERSRR